MNVGDQRAHDLIDEALSETNWQRAIELLYRALAYGTTGIEATKAYQLLGMRYEDIGNTNRAILYYTKALETSVREDLEPEPFVLFWRGELYYQQGNKSAARQDFEQALAAGLWPPEREMAQQRLAELDYIQSDEAYAGE
jgi:tetratricopeptide (TPR) repeat protein